MSCQAPLLGATCRKALAVMLAGGRFGPAMRRLSKGFTLACVLGWTTLVVFGCGSDDGAPAATDTEGLRQCCELGALCHRIVPESEDIQRCHQLGHGNDPAVCRANYEDCLAICAPMGEGGAGGEPTEHACK